jgi:hypothetical protein
MLGRPTDLGGPARRSLRPLSRSPLNGYIVRQTRLAMSSQVKQEDRLLAREAELRSRLTTELEIVASEEHPILHAELVPRLAGPVCLRRS